MTLVTVPSIPSFDRTAIAVDSSQSIPGVITPTQPKVPEANVRGSQEGFQCALVSPERVPGSGRRCQGDLWDPQDPLS